jgi:hypothetical protein
MASPESWRGSNRCVREVLDVLLGLEFLEASSASQIVVPTQKQQRNPKVPQPKV